MSDIRIDLYSDTLTKPSAGMRQAIAEAQVGDEQKYEDPTTNRLQEMVAELLGQESAVFLPTGTMCNQIAYAVHCQAGDEVILDQTAHALSSEAGGGAVIARALLRPLQGERGIFTAEQLAAAIRRPDRHAPVSRLVSVEQTSNFGGGSVWKLEQVRAVCDLAHERGLTTHCDGARLMNAVVATGNSASDFGRNFDSVWIDFSKGLGAPVGAVLAGSKAFIDRAWVWKQRLGGAMRQSGVLAAACIYGLENNVDRLAQDHDNAKRLACGLAEIDGIALDPSTIETNIVFFDLSDSLDANLVAERLETDHGVRVGPVGTRRIRAVTHLDIANHDIDAALEALRSVLGA